MIEYLLASPISFLIWISALLVAITVHEFSHALTADYLGDPTPRINGRLTLNPFSHLDPIGTIFLFLFRFGWGKPVPIDPFNLRNPRRDTALISLSGPLSNLVLAIIISLLIRILDSFLFLKFNLPTQILILILKPIVVMNVILGVFNLFPLHPLDGGKILVGFLPRDKAEEVDQIFSQYGFFILLLLIFPFFGTSLISLIISPIINFLLSLLLPGLILT
jgi:Zn-dependent protease